uniref:Uncharacterized protein n=1 Tax=Arundo donax TaxID=35708 RepID=A0A0A8Z6Z0_ARUDO
MRAKRGQRPHLPVHGQAPDAAALIHLLRLPILRRRAIAAAGAQAARQRGGRGGSGRCGRARRRRTSRRWRAMGSGTRSQSRGTRCRRQSRHCGWGSPGR